MAESEVEKAIQELQQVGIDFGKDEIGFQGTRIKYADIESVAYIAKKNYVNGVPVNTTFSFDVKSAGKHISIKPTLLQEHKLDLFTLLTHLSARLIEPDLSQRVLKKIQAGGELKFHYFSVMKDGIRYKKFIGKAHMPWKEFLRTSIDHGRVNLYRKAGERYKLFTYTPLSEDNAPILPHLLDVISDKVIRL